MVFWKSAGIRHAAEIADYAYNRLLNSLSTIAVDYRSGKKDHNFAGPFLDAWAIVDAVDRLRSLSNLLPGMDAKPLIESEPSFLTRTQAIRDVRNVSDLIAQRVPYVIAKKSSALGILSWFTPIDDSSGLSCCIVPGTLRQLQAPFVNPAGKKLSSPSCLINVSRR